jgi:hypothetical protein
MLRVFPGSTVPNGHFMVRHVEHAADACNLAPTGLHRYVIGTHRGKFHGALRQGTTYPPHRLPLKLAESPGLNKLIYTNEVTSHSRPNLLSRSPIVSVGVNIHPAFDMSVPNPLHFSSAGCQVIAGDQLVSKSTGAQVAKGFWAKFRDSAGLETPIGTHQDGVHYDYLLISGREAYLTSKVADLALLHRFRFGSIDHPTAGAVFGGVTVKEFQRALADRATQPGPFRSLVQQCCLPSDLLPDGKFFGGTMRLVLAWQAVNRGFADGIAAHEMLEALNLA